MVRIHLESLDVCFAVVAIVGMIVAALFLRGMYRSLDAIGTPPRPPLPSASLPSCPHCGETMDRVVALPTWYVYELMARGMPAPDYVCCERGCTVGGRVVYCYAVKPGEPVRLGPPKPAPEEEV
jgi:hypothetical protein